MQAICRLISFFLHVIKVLFFSGKPSIVTNIITCLRLVVLWDCVLRLRRRTLHFKHLDTFSISQKKYILNSLYRKKRNSFPYGQVLIPVWRGPKSGRGICNPRLSCCQLVSAVSQPLYPFGHAGIMYTNDISTLLNLFWQHFNVKVNVLHIELSEKRNCCGFC